MASSKGRPASRAARTTAAVSATPTSRAVSRPAVKAADPEPAEDELLEPEEARPAGQPLWLQIVTFALAILGLVISIYETWAEEFNSSHLAGCSVKPGGTFDCGAVLTSPQSHVFGIPVAVLGVLFYVVAVPLFSPWAWRMRRREVHVLRLASAVVGMGFVMYLIYAEFQIGSVCEYCSGVHAVTFLLFCITVVSAALWGLGKRNAAAARA